ncbi:AAA family ATPase [Flavobacterium soyangense]|uniref:AAA family ATPase n=1 Tax=Flavobacterium soyangense TaxID=2023265 RepID=A0A930XV56_9FLAO|nr:AAA family ATPase [Flavobacterium soyangense]MBF2707747.1 AAA family ATPase [Flavobacterium soyangense]
MGCVSKEEILDKITSYDIFNYYLQPYHNSSNLLAAKNISNPFLAEKQETPSFNIFPSMTSNEWRYKDFATGDDGSCFDLTMKLFNLSFPETLEKINSDFTLMLDAENKPIKSVEQIKQVPPKYVAKQRPFTEAELSFWLKYGIDAETLKRFNVSSLEEFSSTSNTGNPYTLKSSPNKFIFAYENDNWIKLYKPLDEKKYKFQYLGTKEPGYIFGWKQLPEKGEKLIVTGGEKDVMSLSAKGFNAITLNSETATLDKKIVNELKLRFNQIIVLYDNDETGLKQSNILAITHGLHRLLLPTLQNNGKDISDYFANGETIKGFNDLLLTAFQTPAPVELYIDKSVYNAVELLARGEVEQKYLMEPIFPQKGSAVLAGKPDTGKSQFARQLCIQVALGEKTFLDFELHPLHNRSIYVATEDNEDATRFLINKQFQGLDKDPTQNLRFIFADTMNQEEIIKNLNEQLTLESVDLVVIDSFGDIFQGNDSNNNIAMRNTVKTFDKIGKEHNCLILFVHHINKAAYRVAPGQEHIQGGAGLVQKVRLAIVLSEGAGNTRYFTVVKGNYCPKMYKENSLELHFSEETFLFTNTGIMIPTSELGTQPDTFKKEEKINEIENIAKNVFQDKIYVHKDYLRRYCDVTGKGPADANRKLKIFKDTGIIVECQGGYRLDLPNNNEVINSIENNEDNNGIDF